MLHNRGDGTFEDATTQSGLAGDRDWPTSAAWADLDGDGDLDLYVCHYLALDLEKPTTLPATNRAAGNHYCSPRDFAALPDHVFRNDGGRFVDVTRESGFVDAGGRGLGVLAADLDDDNLIDVYVANDMSANYLFRNLGGFHFEETAVQPAAAQLERLVPVGDGRGVRRFRRRRHARPGGHQLLLGIHHVFPEPWPRNLRRRHRHDRAGGPTRPLLGFGIAFFDANNDGWLDLISANGHVNDHRPVFPWRMPTQLLLGTPRGR